MPASARSLSQALPVPSSAQQQGLQTGPTHVAPLAPGELAHQLRLIPPIDRPVRPCCHCGGAFRPTVKRRLLCHDCFVYCEDDPPTYTLRLTSSLR